MFKSGQTWFFCNLTLGIEHLEGLQNIADEGARVWRLPAIVRCQILVERGDSRCRTLGNGSRCKKIKFADPLRVGGRLLSHCWCKEWGNDTRSCKVAVAQSLKDKKDFRSQKVIAAQSLTRNRRAHVLIYIVKVQSQGRAKSSKVHWLFKERIVHRKLWFVCTGQQHVSGWTSSGWELGKY